MKAILYRVRRYEKHPDCVIGELQVAVVSVTMSDTERIFESVTEIHDELTKPKVWKHLAYTLEPSVAKIYSKDMPKPAAIPEGVYELTKRYSTKFRGDRWFLKDVPYFEGIMLHVGNYPSDTKGCILLGNLVIHQKFLGQSKLADERIRRMMNRQKNYNLLQFIKIENQF